MLMVRIKPDVSSNTPDSDPDEPWELAVSKAKVMEERRECPTLVDPLASAAEGEDEH